MSAKSDVRALFNHDPSLVLGRNKSGTLKMKEDSTGLHYEVDIVAREVNHMVLTAHGPLDFARPVDRKLNSVIESP